MPKIRIPEKQKNDIFGRGYNEVRKRVNRYSKYNMSCFNCEYFYQTRRDMGEVCQNPSVLEYDLVFSEDYSNMYCTQWTPLAPAVENNNSVRGLFKR